MADLALTGSLNEPPYLDITNVIYYLTAGHSLFMLVENGQARPDSRAWQRIMDLEPLLRPELQPNDVAEFK